MSNNSKAGQLNPSHVKEEDDRFIFTIEDADESWFTGYVLSYGQHAQVLMNIPADISPPVR